jgi:hypothetical protein
MCVPYQIGRRCTPLFSRSIIFPLFGLPVSLGTGAFIGKFAPVLHRVIGRNLSPSEAFLLHPMLWHCLLPEIASCGFRMDGYTVLYLSGDTVADPYTILTRISTPVCNLHYSSIVSEHDLNMTGNYSVFLLSNTSLLYGCTVLYG